MKIIAYLVDSAFMLAFAFNSNKMWNYKKRFALKTILHKNRL